MLSVCLVSNIPLHGSVTLDSMRHNSKVFGPEPGSQFSQLTGADTVASGEPLRLYGATIVFPCAF